ncbi:MAG TPA: response regulator, partial [Burkholderiaceae bacterium]|nr:response regulator [Burkholderiaceae bacterium]
AEAAAAGRRGPPPQRIGYRGPRQRILVVDNEEADRELLGSMLRPLGFAIDSAPSGDAAVARLTHAAPSDWPDAVFMDLAMPGIDGWEALRRLHALRRATGLPELPAAIVSANAFDRGLDNDVGITPVDFIVKPVRLAELLDWLERRLALTWVEASPPGAAPTPAATTTGAVARHRAAAIDPPRPLPRPLPEPPPAPPGTAWRLPGPDLLQPLADQLALGYLRGALRQLDAIAAADAAYGPFVDRMRGHARGFQIDAMAALIAPGLPAAPPP